MRKADVIAYFGGTRATARAIQAAGWRCSGSVVSQWPDPIPELAARRIYDISRKRVPLLLDEHYRRGAAE